MVWGDEMEDHSISGYLKRRTTEELESILAFCMHSPRCTHDPSIICEIQTILKDRGITDLPGELYKPAK